MAYGQRFDRALELASELHREQTRKQTPVPYITHLMSVAATVGEQGGTEDEVIGALLHDAVEDQGGLPVLERIRAMFGDDVADIVLGCSDSTEKPKPPWRERKERYLLHLARASSSVRLVSCADKLHNARSIVSDLRRAGVGLSVFGRFTASREETLWYYRSLADAFRTLGPADLAEELALVVAEMERLADVPVDPES